MVGVTYQEGHLLARWFDCRGNISCFLYIRTVVTRSVAFGPFVRPADFVGFF